MSELNAVDHQAMQHMLTEGCVDWDGFGAQLARDTDALLGGLASVLLLASSGSGGRCDDWKCCFF